MCVLYAQPGDPQPKATAAAVVTPAAGETGGLGIVAYIAIVLGGLAAYGAYVYLQQQEKTAA